MNPHGVTKFDTDVVYVSTGLQIETASNSYPTVGGV